MDRTETRIPRFEDKVAFENSAGFPLFFSVDKELPWQNGILLHTQSIIKHL